MSKAQVIRDMASALPDVSRRWFEALSNTFQEFPGVTEEFMTKLQNVGEQFPEAFRQYDSPTLFSALDAAAKGHIDLALIDPQDFRMLANRNLERWLLPEGNLDPYDPVTVDIVRKINEYADMYEHGIQFNAIPHLYGSKQMDDDIIKITGHEGRHRMRAQEKIGANKSLVKIVPRDLHEGADYPEQGWRNTRASEVDPDTFLQPEPYVGDPAADWIPDRLVAGEWQSGSPPMVRPGPYKSIADVLKFLSLGGFSLGALKDLADE